MLNVDAIRARFPALSAEADASSPVVHADAPGGTQAVDTAVEAMSGYLTTANANAHGHFHASKRTDAMCAEVRAKAAGFLGGDAAGTVFGANMTTLTIHFAHAFSRRLSAGDEIVCTRLDHDANVSPWLAAAERTGAITRWVDLDDEGGLDTEQLDTVMSDRTRLIAFPRASNALGTLVDPAPFVAAAGRVGALTFMDAVHAAPHVPLDRRDGGVDVVVCSPYKFFGPHAGILSADPDLLADLNPDKARPAPDTGPERWQTGTANFEAIAGAGAAIDYLDDVGLEAIRDHEVQLAERFLDGLDKLDHVHLHGTRDLHVRTPTFAVTVDGHDPDGVARFMADRDISVWSGHYYAIEPMRALRLLEAGGAVRIGFVHYHGPDHVDRVLDALADLA